MNEALLIDLLNRRPAMNAGLIEAYAHWNAEVYRVLGALSTTAANEPTGAQQPAPSAAAAQTIPGVQWQCGPQANGFTAPQADSQPAPANTRQIAECYGDCPTDPKTCANPCKFEGRAARAPADSEVARPVTPYTCPKCHALWLHWPAEQSGFAMDTLNCRSTTHCDYCEKGGVEQLERLERVPAALKAPQQEAQEPVGYTHASWIAEAKRGGGGSFVGRKNAAFDVPIYTASQPSPTPQADSVTAPAGEAVAGMGETVQFSDKSKAPPLEKARRYLKAMGDQRTNSAYFFDDGYPRRESAQDALATLAVLEQLAAAPTTQPAPQQAATGVGNSGFDHKTASDFLSGKTVTDEAMRGFVASSRAAHDDRESFRAQLLALRGELKSREAEIALLKQSLLDAEAAPSRRRRRPLMAEAQVPRCNCCHTRDVAILMECHNSACRHYANPQRIYEGWRIVAREIGPAVEVPDEYEE